MPASFQRPTQAERVDQSTHRLLEAAAQLVAEQGYHRTTAAQIAERAGYSREMVRVRFGSKAGLIADILASDYQRRLLSASVPSANTGLARLRASAHALKELADESSVFLRAVFVLNLEAATSIPELQPRMTVWLGEVERNFRAHVAEGIGDGSIRLSVHPENKARELLALTIGSAYLYLLDGDQTDPSRLLQAALDDIEADH
ncbi:TetR/AcrR family transcriptional regulator [Mycobacterium sp. AZCC_0083]|uniref:TetR/AcrR family transcriptional regulator n=1 Tax=Mycobacterium sp. AZCC_0083 TaxID=2735882 RepID=UPI0016075CD9|nr:TetR/AcrR family transcriptional regulator [Mycobacterium sp. AZCC_0083]MBB5163648.1 AcrR family transcriptional regulator [Mycobacterium sp. AZCC_0083]